MQYELFYLVGEKQESNLEKIKEDVNTLLTQEGAKLLEGEIIEKRKLAYEIKHQKKGTYITKRFEIEDVDFDDDEKKQKGNIFQNINNKLNLKTDVLRHIIVKTSDLPEPGAKERRKAMELNNQKSQQVPTKEKRTIEKNKVEENKVKESLQKNKKTIVTKEIEDEKIEDKKENIKDIDKQLDELLKI